MITSARAVARRLRFTRRHLWPAPERPSDRSLTWWSHLHWHLSSPRRCGLDDLCGAAGGWPHLSGPRSRLGHRRVFPPALDAHLWSEFTAMERTGPCGWVSGRGIRTSSAPKPKWALEPRLSKTWRGAGREGFHPLVASPDVAASRPTVLGWRRCVAAMFR